MFSGVIFLIIRRPLVLAVLCFILGIIFCILEITPFLAVFLFSAGLLYILFYKREAMPLFLLIFLTTALGTARFYFYRENMQKKVSLLNESTVNGTVTALDFSSDGKAVSTLTFKGNTYKIYLSTSQISLIKPGDTFDAELSLYTPLEDDSLFGFSSYLKGRGILFYANADALEPLEPDLKGLRGCVFSVRRFISEHSAKYFKGTTHALYNSMVLGDKSFLKGELSTLLKTAGLSHITVVSGMHLSIMVNTFTFLTALLLGKRRLWTFLTFIPVIFITFVCGVGASVVRAAIMCSVLLTAKLLNREADGLTSLFLSVLIMALFNPFIILNTGFILSVLSVLGILLYSKKITSLFSKCLPSVMANAASVCISAQLLVVPALIIFYEEVNPYALISNLLVFIFASLLVISGMIFTVLSFLPFIGALLKFSVSFSADAIIAVCRYISYLPFSDIKAEGISPLFMIFWIFLLLLIYMGLKNTGKSS